MNKFFKYSLIVAGISMAVGVVFALISTVIGGRIVINNSIWLLRQLRNLDILDEIDDWDEAHHGFWHWGWQEDDTSKELIVNGKTQNREVPIEEVPDGKAPIGETSTEESLTGEKIVIEETPAGETQNGKKQELTAIQEPGEISAAGIRNLDLDLGAGQFYIQEKDSDDGIISIWVQGVGTCDYYTKKDTLHVESFKGNHFIGEDLSKNQIIIDLPKGMYFDEVELTCGAAVAELDYINANELEVEAGAGEVRVNSANVMKFSANVGVGRVEADNVEASEVDLEVGMGECVYYGSVLRELDAECDLGNMEIMIKGAEEDYNYEIECSAGNIDLGGKSITGLGAERKINNGAPKTCELSCNMGNISVSFSN